MAVILIVEDEAFTRELAGMYIEDWGHETIIADGAQQALPFLRSGQPINALFTDVYLQADVFGGCELAREAVQLRPDLRVLYTTGNAATTQLKSRFITGSYFLGKPYTPSQLHDSIDGMLAD